MTIVHIVMFHFPPSIPKEVTKAVITELKTKCLHPTTQKPYILSYKAGVDCSCEGRQDGISHTFVMEFENLEDRNYYVGEDPVHLEFVKSMNGKGAEKVQVTDFVVGEY
ncbi:stress responsive A/B barrel domain-containing protein [Choiromyces venosus 120613-1]|uniref:Stress responsive A/B barrel domain-containing protein n=1 Tax=Choiromyces venosus 120613-1 TaxID=1336337 RepID=A0A3N4JDG3_9PEZI|nr:stress responsive A/B barrel domain-containing protein [Choiromyces venosus 120613-1]